MCTINSRSLLMSDLNMMGSFKVLLFLCVSVIIGNCNCKQNTIAQHCQLPLESSKFKGGFWPLIFSTKSSDPAVTLQSSAFVVNNDAEVVLSCAPNYFRNIPKTQTVSVTCDGNSGKFDYKSNSKTISKGMDYFSCDLRVIEEVLDPVNGCTKGGWVSTKFGFVQPIEEKTYILGEACYDNEMGRTVFVHVKLDADRYYLEKLQPNYLSSKPHPGSENKIDLLRKLKFDKIYESMEQDLNLKYPIPLELSHYIDPSQWFEVHYRGVLKLGWNYFVKFDAEETFNQLRLAVKSLSLTKAVDVYVGGYGISVLSNLAKSKEMYIDDVAKRFPIPKILWMLVKHENKALGFAVYNNNNEVNSVNSRVAKCETECKQVTWLATNKDLDSHVLCCTYEELKNIIPDVPDLERIQMALL